MSEEEKHAIEFFNKVIYQIGEEDIMKNNCILLNLIDKLQKENEELKEMFKQERDDFNKVYRENKRISKKYQELLSKK